MSDAETLSRKRGRITILLGAGSIMDIDHAKGASTSAITNIITDPSMHNDSTNIAFAKALRQYKNELESKGKVCNFEDLYYAVTLLTHYHELHGDVFLQSLFDLKKIVKQDDGIRKEVGRVIDGENTSNIELYDAARAQLKKLSVDASNDLTKDVEITNLQSILVMNFILRQIALSVKKYCVDSCSDYQNDPSLNYFYRFFNNLDEWTGGNCDIYTLCYDDLIEKCLPNHYVNGFTEEGKNDRLTYNPVESLTDRSTNIVNHLHGSIYYSLNTDSENGGEWSRFFDLTKSVNYCPGNFSISGVANELFIASPIVTGLNKMENMIIEPFRSYYSNFNNSVLTNNLTIIIGYSFGDVHINQVLYAARKINSSGTVIMISPDKDVISDQFNYFSRDYGENIGKKIKKNSNIWYVAGFKEAVEETDLMEVLKTLIMRD